MGMVCLRRKTVLSAVLFVLFLVSVFVPSASASPEQDKALEILDSRTSSHWGEDNLAWVVHYPEGLVEPWVKAQAAKRKLNAEQTEQYRKSFTDELKVGAATAILLSVHSYGGAPLKLAPISKNVTLIDSSGKRISPMVYEKKLDNPIGGLMQGFVFFPLQKDDNFRIAVKGLVSDRETIFAFGDFSGATIATATGGSGSVAKKPQNAAGQQKEAIVRIPTTKPPASPTPPKTPVASPDAKREEPEFSTAGEIYAPTTPREVPPPSDPPISSPPAGQEAPPSPQKAAAQTLSRLAPRQALDVFLKAWIKGDTDRMYELLSSESQTRISKDLFEKDVLAGGFRQGLRDGYKVAWEGNSAKVTVSRKMLLMRSLDSKRFDFVEENGSARIAW